MKTVLAMFLLVSIIGGILRTANADDVAHLLQQLHDPDVQRRRDAARALSSVKPLPPEALDALAASIQRPDEDATVGSFAWTAVCASGKSANPIAMRMIKSKEKFVSDQGVGLLECLAREDKNLWPVLIGIYKENPASNAITALSGFGPAALPLVFDALKSDDPTLRTGALLVIQQMVDNARSGSAESAAKNHITLIAPTDLAPVEPQLAAALTDSDPVMRGRAAIALSFLDPKDPRPLPVLIGFVKERNVGFIGSAITALASMGDLAKPAVPALQHVLATDEDNLLRIDAGKALVQIEGTAACAPLENAIEKDREWREGHIGTAMQITPRCPNLIPTLIGTFRDEYPTLRAAAALSTMGQAAVPALAAALKSPNLYMRQNAADALAGMKPLPPEAITALQRALNDPNSEVRGSARMALSAVGGEAQREAEASYQHAEQATPIPGSDESLHSRKQIEAPIPPDSDYMFAAELRYLLPIKAPGMANAAFVITVHAGKDRPDRLVIWKRIGANRYQQYKVMYSEEEYLGLGYHFERPFTFSHDYERIEAGGTSSHTGFFVDAPLSGWRMYQDNIFVAENDQLAELGADSRFKGLADFHGGKMEFIDPIYSKDDPTCCPTGGSVTGSYKIVEDVRRAPPSWDIVVAASKRNPPAPN